MSNSELPEVVPLTAEQKYQLLLDFARRVSMSNNGMAGAASAVLTKVQSE